MPEINNGTIGFFGAIGEGTSLAQRFTEGMRNAFYGASHEDKIFRQAKEIVEGDGALPLYDGNVDNDTSWLGKFKQLSMEEVTEFKQRLIDEIAKDKCTKIIEGNVTLDNISDVINSICEDCKEYAEKVIIIDSLPYMSSVPPALSEEQAKRAMIQIKRVAEKARLNITDCEYSGTLDELATKYNLNDTRVLQSLEQSHPDDPVGEAHCHGDSLPNDDTRRVAVTLVKNRHSTMPSQPLIFTIENDIPSYLIDVMNYNEFDGDHLNEIVLDELDDYKTIKDDKPKYKFNKHNGGMTMQSNKWYDIGHKRGKGCSKKGRRKR